MSQIDIQDLFEESRFPSGWRLLTLLLYTPIGVLLVLLRSFISLHLYLLSLVIPDCSALRTFLRHSFCLVFGTVVRIEGNGEPTDKESRIIISNNISALDHFALRRATGAITPNLWSLPASLSDALGLKEMNMSSKDSLVRNIKEFISISNNRVALQPEFGLTNGRVALLKFNTWPFGIDDTVQPVAIKISRSQFVDVKVTSIAATWWTDVFWFMFVPWTVYTLTFLKIKRNGDQETLAREVEKDIASALNLKTCTLTVSDKTEFEKRYVLETTRSEHSRNRGTGANVHSNNGSINPSMEMQRMARQVSEVLPLVPRNVILKDLLKTRNVDITIANILDGIVTYTPEPTRTMTTTMTTTTSAMTNNIIPETSVGKSRINSKKDNSGIATTSSTSLSFREKKAKMIQEARERYILKHGLTNC